MLEILFLIGVYRTLGNKAMSKGHSKGWGALGILFWVLGEIVGFIIGGALDLGMGAYLLALFCAAIGAGIAYLIVNSLGSRLDETAGYDDGGAGIGTFDPNNPYSPPGTMGKR